MKRSCASHVTNADSHLHGLLIVDKPGLDSIQRLPTSHDIVQQVRRWSGQRRIGHTGTLDPFASGVLALCLGQATRLVEYYQGHDKRYLAEIALSIATDAFDVTGAVTERAEIPPLSVDDVERGLSRFRGRIMQIPPSYSALKQGGESLYQKARRGETVVAPPRPVTFHSIELLSFAPPDRITARVVCSAGAYIRSLAHDLGKALGTAAHLAALRREAAGPFTLEHAHTPDQIHAAAQAGAFDRLLLPTGAGLDFPSIEVDEAAARRFGFGQVVALARDNMQGAPMNAFAASQEFSEIILAQGRARDGRFLGVLRRVGESEGGETVWKAEKWFGG